MGDWGPFLKNNMLPFPTPPKLSSIELYMQRRTSCSSYNMLGFTEESFVGKIEHQRDLSSIT